MRIVLLTPLPFWHPGTGELVSYLKAEGLAVASLDIFNGRYMDEDGVLLEAKPQWLKGFCAKVYLRLFRNHLIAKHVKDDDILDIHFVEPAYGRYLAALTRRKVKLITSLFGSDLFRTSQSQKELQRPVFQRADAVVLSENMIPYFAEHFSGCANKFYRTQYGSARLDLIDQLVRSSEPKCSKSTLS